NVGLRQMVLRLPLGEALAGVNQHDLTLAGCGLALVENHDYAGRGGVVEEVVGQQDDALDEVVVDEPLPNVPFLVLVPGAGTARQGSAVEDHCRSTSVVEGEKRVL